MKTSNELKPEILEHRSACYAYATICEKSEASREVALQLRESRFAAFAKKKETAENLVMKLMNLFETSIRKMGTYQMFSKLSSGSEDPTMLFKVAREISLSYEE